jgi:hypothetical protein
MIQEQLDVAKSAIYRVQMLMREECEPLRVLVQAHSNVENFVSNKEFEVRNHEFDKARWDKEFKAEVKKLMAFAFPDEMVSYLEMRRLPLSTSVPEAVMKAFHDPNQNHVFCILARIYTDIEGRTKE